MTMDDRTIPSLAALAKNALIAGHAPGDVFDLVGELFNLVAPKPADAPPIAAPQVSTATLTSRLNAAATQPPFVGATPAG